MATNPLLLARIRVLYREPYKLWLWGIPYDLRPGQSPIHLQKGFEELQRNWPCEKPLPWSLEDWIYLDSPSKPTQDPFILEFLKKHAADIPMNHFEFCTLPFC